MSADDQADPKTKFAFQRAPDSEILYRINDGVAARVEPAALAAEIRKHGVEAMPESVQILLCSILEGNSENRGRKGKSKSEKFFEAHRLAMLYSAVYAVIRGRVIEVPSFVAFVEQHQAEYGNDVANGEKAWRIVSRMVEGSDGHYRKLQNFVSKFSPKNQ